MKIRFLLILFLLPVYVSSQEECKVLLKELDSVYIGACKNGLAHGQGEAWGDFHYFGKFSKGLPHGEGMAEYPNGTVYNGFWKKGLRHGKGTLSVPKNGQMVNKTYAWSKGKQTREIAPPAYKVLMRRNIARLRVYSRGSGNEVWFSALSEGGKTNVENIRVTGSTGNKVKIGSSFGFEDVNFPFTGIIKYSTWNKVQKAHFEVFLEIEIFKPGNWIIEIQN
jgi:hypothetical protein